MKQFAKIGRSVRPITRSLTIAAALTILGCAYGKTHISEVEGDQVRAFVEQNYENLRAYYSGERERPGAILMDPKSDGVILVPDKWEPISSKEELLELMDRMVQAYYRKMKGEAGVFGPRLQLVLDKDDKRIGYFYSPVDNWPVRPEGSNYSVDPVTYVQVREWSQGGILRPGRKGRK